MPQPRYTLSTGSTVDAVAQHDGTSKIQICSSVSGCFVIDAARHIDVKRKLAADTPLSREQRAQTEAYRHRPTTRDRQRSLSRRGSYR